MAGFHRLGRLLALVAMLLNQPLTSIHAATDEEHLSHPVAQTAHLAGATHDAGHRHEGPQHSDDHHHQTCQVCVLVGSALAPSGAVKMANASAWHHAAGPAAVQASMERRLRVGDPVRAPPVHLV